MITRSVLFSLKCTRNRLAAGLCPDPLGELERSPRSSSSRPPGRDGRRERMKGKWGGGGEGKGKGREEEGKGKEGRVHPPNVH